MIYDIFVALMLWQLFGFIFLVIIHTASMRLDNCLLLNPREVYNEFKVNCFGCGLIVLFANLCCPLFALLYWFCKLMKFICTVGRR